MNSAVRTLIAALTAIAIALPSVSAAVPASRSAEQPGIAGDRSAIIAERQQRTWLQLSGSICTGCINAANRVAPVSYDKPSVIALAQSSPRLQSVSRRVRAKVRFAHVRTRYARLQRRDRRRIAIRTHPVRIAKRLHRRIFARHHVAPDVRQVARQVARPIVWPVGLIRVEDRLPERPAGRPWVPQDDNRWHTTILPAATMRSRRS